VLVVSLVTITASGCTGGAPADQRWPEERAAAWHSAQPWRVGANYVPSNAINQLEMWQPETFDLARIDQELGWAERIGMNTMRVFLHDLPWLADSAGFASRIDAFLDVADRHGIKSMLVLFDSCWDPFPQAGPQRAPAPGVHNSGWVQSPGVKALADPNEHPRLERYVREVVRAFADDPRVLAWDVWNEPDGISDMGYPGVEPPNKVELVEALLPKVFAWARASSPRQPLTSGLWRGDWSSHAKLSKVERIQIEQSDVVSFHNYQGPAELEERIRWLSRYGRPILLTEYMARSNGSTFHGSLPVLKKHKVAAMSWGLVAGKTQTYFPWSSWKEPMTEEPSPWFHDVLRDDGSPWDPEEVALFRALR
jgi:hypothetical protein